MPSRDERNQKYGRAPKGAYVPLKITARLETAVVGDYSLPFDGLLYHLAHRKVLGAQQCAASGASVSAGSSGAYLPLARCNEHCHEWYYAASYVQWGVFAEGLDHWNCRVDVSLAHLIDFRSRRGNIDISSSTYKAYHQPIFYRHASQVVWYVRGLPGEIRQLLRFATHLGKKTSQGWGAVGGWDVVECGADWSVHGEQGQLMRAVPAERGMVVGYRPSYWHPRNQGICAVPEVR